MGLDLTLIPVEHEAGGKGRGHTLLNLTHREDLFGEIGCNEKQEGGPVPQRFMTNVSRDDRYEEQHYGDTQRTPYGEALRTVTAESLLSHKHHRGVADNPRNRAAWAYLAELPPETEVALYWH